MRKSVELTQDRIIEALKKSERPLSTRELSIKLGKAWYTISTACLRLQIANRVETMRIGNVQIWSIKKK